MGAFGPLPWSHQDRLDRAITADGFPRARSLSALPFVLALVALELSYVKRKGVEVLCHRDRALGPFPDLTYCPIPHHKCPAAHS